MVPDAQLVDHFSKGGTRRPFFLDEGVIEVENHDRAPHPSRAIKENRGTPNSRQNRERAGGTVGCFA